MGASGPGEGAMSGGTGAPIEADVYRHGLRQEQSWGRDGIRMGVLESWRVGSTETRMIGAGWSWDPSTGDDESCGFYCTDQPGARR